MKYYICKLYDMCIADINRRVTWWKPKGQSFFRGSESEDQFAADLVYSQRRFFRKDQTHTAEPKKLQLLGLTNAQDVQFWIVNYSLLG